MEKIQHKFVEVNGINMHVAEIGQGPAVLFVHGFLELWYSWRHQMLSLSSRGYRAIAPDMRGYGDTEAPPLYTSYTVFHVVGDLVALLDALQLDKVFVVGHNWGAIICWTLCLIRPDRVKALVNTSAVGVLNPRNPAKRPLERFREMFGDECYVCRFQEEKLDEEFAAADAAKLIMAFYANRDPKPPLLPKVLTIAQYLEHAPDTLPPWLTVEDLHYYATKFSTTGFAGGLNYYRCLNLNWELMAPWTGAKLQVPAKFIVGDLDLTYHSSQVKEFIHGGGLKNFVPNLEEVVVLEGVAHYLNQEKPEEINDHIYNFIQKF